MDKVLVAFGANAAVVGLFLPMARVVERLNSSDRHYDVRIWGGLDATNLGELYGYVLLALFLVLELMGIWALATDMTRARALVTLAFGAPAEGLAVYVLLFHLGSMPGDAQAGPGLVLMVIGGAMIVVGAFWAIVRTTLERRRSQEGPRPRAA